MNLLKWTSAGLAGGLLGAGLWAAFTHFTNIEFGMLAWLIGVLAGIAVRASAGDEIGRASGVCAVGSAVFGVAIGKLAVSYLMVSAFIAGSNMSLGADAEEYAVSYMADVVVREQLREGHTIKWPSGVDPESVSEESDYPRQIWAEAKRRWESLRPDQRERCKANPNLVDPEFTKFHLAWKKLEELQEQGQDIDANYDAPDHATGAQAFPSEVWTDVEARWAAMNASERVNAEDEAMADYRDSVSTAAPQLILAGALYSLSIWDMLWLGLAGLSAWRIGSGGSSVAES